VQWGRFPQKVDRNFFSLFVFRRIALTCNDLLRKDGRKLARKVDKMYEELKESIRCGAPTGEVRVSELGEAKHMRSVRGYSQVI
jgi:hypothetical protein